MLKKIGRSKYKIEEINVENDPIDFVFTYVDFNDQGYQKKLINQAKKKDSSLLKSKENFLNRYIDYGEIYLSIYSVKKNLKFIRNIYIVTPTPNKIKEVYKDDKKIKIINDKELLVNQQVSRPCFKSTVIESFLYLIPNLSNVFLYGCDDMMIANELKKESLFLDNIPYIFLDERRNLPHKVKNNTSPAFADIINTNNIFNKKFNKYYSLTHNHQITLMRRDLCQITHDIFKEEILKNSANMFRTPIKDNLHFFLLASFLGIHLNLLVKGNVKASGFYEMAYNKPWQRFYNYKNKGIKYFCVNTFSDVYYSYY